MPCEPHCGTAVRAIRSASLMALTHQTLLTSTKEWNLRSRMESISQVKPTLNGRGYQGSSCLHVLEPCSQPPTAWLCEQRENSHSRRGEGQSHGPVHKACPGTEQQCALGATLCDWHRVQLNWEWGPGPSLYSLGYTTPGAPMKWRKLQAVIHSFSKVATVWNKITLKKIWCPSPQKNQSSYYKSVFVFPVCSILLGSPVCLSKQWQSAAQPEIATLLTPVFLVYFCTLRRPRYFQKGFAFKGFS